MTTRFQCPLFQMSTALRLYCPRTTVRLQIVLSRSPAAQGLVNLETLEEVAEPQVAEAPQVAEVVVEVVNLMCRTCIPHYSLPRKYCHLSTNNADGTAGTRSRVSHHRNPTHKIVEKNHRNKLSMTHFVKMNPMSLMNPLMNPMNPTRNHLRKQTLRLLWMLLLLSTPDLPSSQLM